MGQGLEVRLDGVSGGIVKAVSVHVSHAVGEYEHNEMQIHASSWILYVFQGWGQLHHDTEFLQRSAIQSLTFGIKFQFLIDMYLKPENTTNCPVMNSID